MNDPRAVAFPDILESQIRAGAITCTEALEQLRGIGADPLDYAVRMLMAAAKLPEHEKLADSLVYSVDPVVREQEARKGLDVMVEQLRELRSIVETIDNPEIRNIIGLLMSSALTPRG